MIFGKIRAVAFDAVGTLIEPSPSVAEAYRRAAAEQGVALPVEVIRERFGHAFSSDDASPTHATDETSEYRRWRRIVAECLPELDESKADAAFERLWRHFAEPGNWRLFSDALPLIEFFEDQDIRICVASNFDSRLRDVCRGLKGAESLVDRLVISSEVGVRKPGKLFYQAVTATLGHAANETLFIGDDLVNDFRVPQEMGFDAVLVDRRGRFGESRSVLRLTDLLPILEASQ